MGLLGILLIVFILLKAFSVIDWSWWLVFIPAYIIGAIVIVQILLFVVIGTKTRKEFNKFKW
ncbi:hypothetical protein [Metasolibacillus sp.]|uniref:hypothetical protein n=1 Tax=Metasolibacillus sp. TaxID=2703680 RepID=UPI0025CBDA7D|nr:hypothetical protein [Metasolibacillus sp.]MCT6924600.1 hypothetical protein [Metasolibacillus sp.]MCT6940802.1 hypothetical protein [Metasolibacillus sp.]